MTFLIMLLAGGAAVVLLLLLVLLGWLTPGARRRRAFGRGQTLLHQGDASTALAIFDDLYQHENLSTTWDEKLRHAMSACHRQLGEDYLRHKAFEDALRELQRAAELQKQDITPVREHVVDTLLEEVRHQFSQTTGTDTAALHQLLNRALSLHQPCPEASFWQALCQVREGDKQQAVTTLQTIVTHETADRKIDPYFYLGSLLLDRGEAREALRYLTEANRIESNYPPVICQLARAMIAAGGDVQFAQRALQRALGENGLQKWSHAPHLVWVEGFPEGKSYVRKLASRYNFTCPLWGKDYRNLQRAASTALGEGYYRLGQYEQAIEIFDRLSHEAAPSLTVLRGLGMSLVRQEKYDEAFKHLRTAHEIETPKNHRTAGYLGLCAAKGKPASSEDWINNINWAIWLVRDFSIAGDEEWAGLLNEIFAEARAAGIDAEEIDQIHLCDHLVSVAATDPLAADAYYQLETTFPRAVRPEYAWLYCRAAAVHDLHHPEANRLFHRLYQDTDQARAYFQDRGWNFDDLEYTFLARAAAAEPGCFPEVLGADYPLRGERFLLERMTALQTDGQLEEAVQTAEVLVKLAPHHAQARDSLARLYFQTGELAHAIDLLQAWRHHDPESWQPLVRLAILHHQQGQHDDATACLQEALTKTTSAVRAEIAFLGARLQLAHVLGEAKEVNGDASGLRQTTDYLRQCLADNPAHPHADWCLAGVLLLSGDHQALPEVVAALSRNPHADARRHVLTAVCHLLAGNPHDVQQACNNLQGQDGWTEECAYLLGWTAVAENDTVRASEQFTRSVQGTSKASRTHARAVLGNLKFQQGEYQQAVHHWNSVADEPRDRWGLTEPLARTMFLAALQSLDAGQFVQAAVELREAGKLGFRDKRLGQLLGVALLQAGRQTLYE